MLGVFFQPNPNAMVFYEALALYGEVVMETVQDGDDFRDGLEICKRLKNRTFDGERNFFSISIIIIIIKFIIIIIIISFIII